jgi:translation elongation factor EF-4
MLVQSCSLIVGARGHQKHISYVDAQLAVIDFEAPLANLLTDFYDQLKVNNQRLWIV